MRPDREAADGGPAGTGLVLTGAEGGWDELLAGYEHLPVERLGYLSEEHLPALYRQALPDTMRGADFLARYGDHHDPATVVEPEVEYAVRGCAEHAIYENACGFG